MAVRFFKKLSPQTKVTLADGGIIEFSTVDGLTGWFATDQDLVAKEFERFMKEQRYAISEVSEPEFRTEYIEKKRVAAELKPVWREELSAQMPAPTGPVQRLGPEAVAAAVAVEKSDLKPKRPMAVAVTDVSEVAANGTLPAAQPAKPFTPVTSRREPRRTVARPPTSP